MKKREGGGVRKKGERGIKKVSRVGVGACGLDILKKITSTKLLSALP